VENFFSHKAAKLAKKDKEMNLLKNLSVFAPLRETFSVPRQNRDLRFAPSGLSGVRKKMGVKQPLEVLKSIRVV